MRSSPARSATLILAIFFFIGAQALQSSAKPTVTREVDLKFGLEMASMEIKDRFTVPGQISLSFSLATWMQIDAISLNGEAIHSTPARRYLKTDPIPDDVLWTILDAAIRGPSGGNSQGWGWVVVTDGPGSRDALRPRASRRDSS